MTAAPRRCYSVGVRRLREGVDVLSLGSEFERAVIYALHIHGGHRRKGTAIPYVSHLLAVAASVIEHGGSETEAIAGLLHDAVEDQGGLARLQDIRTRFGEEVAGIVAACTDSFDGSAVDEKEDWLMRKRRYLAALPAKSGSIHRVSAADKLHNARAIWRDVATGGESVWRRFSKPPEQTIAFYTALSRILCSVHPGPLTMELRLAVELLERHIRDEAAHRAHLQDLLARADA